VVAVVSAPAPNMSTRIETNWSSVEIKEFTIIVYVIQPERFIDTDGKVYNQDKVLTFSLGKFISINIMISILLTVILTLSLDWA
jgi:hypothetical protein